MNLKNDNFLLYYACVSIITTTIISVIFKSGIATGIWLVVVGIGLIVFIEKFYTKEVKIVSPFPVRLNGKWMFVFYVVGGTYMLSPEDLLMHKIKNSG